MSKIGLVPFETHCPEIADRETRSIIVREGGLVPPGEYCLVEFYCQDPNCDCRRVILQVRERSRPGDVLASIAFGWESPDFYARKLGGDRELAEVMSGASLDPMLPQSKHAKAFFQIIGEMCFTDADFIRRLMRHYEVFRRRGDADKTPPQRGAKSEGVFEGLKAEITRFGKEHLDEELTGFALELLGRLRNDSGLALDRGQPAVWAAAVVHVIARINFLFDSSQPVHLTFDTICEFFGTKKTTVGTKATQIERSLALKSHAEPGLTRPALFEQFSMVRLSNGMVVSRMQAKAMGLL